MNRIKVATILLAALGMLAPAREAPAQVSITVTLGGFYDELSPYGDWVDCSYGECWAPRGVGASWQPYSNGEWVYTRYGWTWMSDDPWGGDPYHYGTWTFLSRRGWVWVPGSVWAPAWVTWSYSDHYVGWAPMPPDVTFGHSGYSGRPVVVNQAHYVFVPTDRFVGTRVSSVRMEPRRNAEMLRQGTPVTRFEVSAGIVTNAALPIATIQRAAGARIETRDVRVAHTTPRTVAYGGVSTRTAVPIVAPEREIRAARSSRQEPQHHAEQGQQQREREQAQQAQQQREKQHAEQGQQPQEQQHGKSPDKGKGQDKEKEKKDKDGGQVHR